METFGKLFERFLVFVGSEVARLRASHRPPPSRVEDWRGIPKVKPICVLPVSSGSASIAEP